MRGDDNDLSYLFGWLVAAVISAIFLLFIFKVGLSEALCSNEDSNCFRAWIDATSGWGAVAAAAITLGYLSKQISLQHQQNGFQLGDSFPTLDVVQHAEQPMRAIAHFRNWNRRSAIIKSAIIDRPDGVTEWVMMYTGSGKYIEDGNIIRFKPALIVGGWVDRSNEPELIKLSLFAGAAQGEMPITNWEGFRIRLVYEMVGLKGVYIADTEVHLTSVAPPSIDEVETAIK